MTSRSAVWIYYLSAPCCRPRCKYQMGFDLVDIRDQKTNVHQWYDLCADRFSFERFGQQQLIRESIVSAQSYVSHWIGALRFCSVCNVSHSCTQCDKAILHLLGLWDFLQVLSFVFAWFCRLIWKARIILIYTKKRKLNKHNGDGVSVRVCKLLKKFDDTTEKA